MRPASSASSRSSIAPSSGASIASFAIVAGTDDPGPVTAEGHPVGRTLVGRERRIVQKARNRQPEGVAHVAVIGIGRKLERFLTAAMRVYRVPEPDQQAVLSYIAGLDVKALASGVSFPSSSFSLDF